MDLVTYQKLKAERLEEVFARRETCDRCKKAAVVCYCQGIRPFAAWPRFVILIHKGESRRGVASGRMAHLCLSDSLFFQGTNHTHNATINRLLADPAYSPAVLYPGPKAVNLSDIAYAERRALFPEGKRPLVFVYDGTWRTSRAMRRLTENLLELPQYVMTPRRPSAFMVRQQPRPECLSTLEAIHEVIDLLTPTEQVERPHDHLLDVFGAMVRTQVAYTKNTDGIATRGLRRRHS